MNMNWRECRKLFEKDGSTALYQIEKKVNILDLDCKEEGIVDSTDDYMDHRDDLETVECEDEPVSNVKHSARNTKDFICKKYKEEVQNSSSSVMHKFWQQNFNAFMEKGRASVEDGGKV